jgi:hypothetical protein
MYQSAMKDLMILINCTNYFWHCGPEALNNTTELYGFKSSGNLETYEKCSIMKAKQKNVNKN